MFCPECQDMPHGVIDAMVPEDAVGRTTLLLLLRLAALRATVGEGN